MARLVALGFSRGSPCHQSPVKRASAPEVRLAIHREVPASALASRIVILSVAKDLFWLLSCNSRGAPLPLLLFLSPGKNSLWRCGSATRHRSKRQRRALYQPGASPQGKTAPEGASALPKAGVKAKPKRLNCLPPPRHNRHSTPPAQKGNPKSLVKPPNHLNPTKQREKSVHINTTQLSIIEIELKKRSRTNSGAPSIRSFIADGWVRRTHPTHSRDFEHKISGINILPRIIAANLTF